MVVLQTFGSVDAQRKLPAPRQYVAIGAVWGILFLLADTGLGRLAARLSLLMLLTASVLGPFGKRFVGIATAIAQQFAIKPDQATSPTSAATVTGNVPQRI